MAKKWLTFCGIGCVVAVISGIAVVFVVYKSSGFGRAAGDIDGMMAKAKAAGLPLESADLVKHQKDDAKLNLATYCQQYSKMLDSDPRLDSDVTNYRSQLKREQDYHTILANLSGLDKLAKLGVKASKSKYFEGVVDWDAYASSEAPGSSSYKGVKGLTILLAGRARAEMLSGSSGAALTDFYRAAKISSLCGTEPSVIAQLVRNACEAIILSNLEYTLPKQANSPALLSQSKAFLDSLSPLGEPVASGKAEFMIGLSLCRNLRSMADAQAMVNGKMNSMPPPKSLQKRGAPTTVFGKAFASAFIENWLELLAISKKPMSDLERLEAYKDFEKRLNGKKGVEHLTSQASMGLFNSVQESIIRHNSQMACLKALVQVLQYRARHRCLPSSLAEAGVKELDPYTEQPLKLIADAYSISVYSLGPNKVDDHGTPKSNGTGDNFDIVATCPIIK